MHLGNGQAPPKRTKVEDPIQALLTSTSQPHASSAAAVFRLQVLLFFIDRHWNTLHPELQQTARSTLVAHLSSDDPSKQSWSFLCLGAICSAQASAVADSTDWTSLWSHAIRRVNVPHVSRAACHAANIFIASNKLPSARVLGDIEALANDLTVQGPPFPYDSVCIFLGECLKIAGQDVRLYRMQLEEKVMSWLSSTWNVVNGTSKSQSRSRLEAHSLKDVLALFEVICTLPKRNEPVCSVLLPEGAITDRMIYERSTAVIRDYLLQARLPRFKAFTPTGPVLPATAPETRSADFALPTAREAHVSTFLQRSLEMLTAEWDGIKEADTKTTAEKVRRSIDFVVLSLSLQASLLLNGTRSNRRVVQAALKLLALLRPSLHLKRWSPKERATVILGLEPLVGSDALTNEDERWEVMLEPRKGSGIKMRTLAGLINRRDGRAHNLRVWRMEAQKLLWENSDVSCHRSHPLSPADGDSTGPGGFHRSFV
jgi:ataxia telangiectasia mutated family protein